MYENIEDLMVERIVRRQEIANEKILKEIGKVLGEIGELTPSTVNTIKQQLKYGESLDKIVKILSETSNINQEEIYKILEKSATETLNEAKKYYKARNIDYIPYSKNKPLQNLVKEIAITTLETYKNISNTTGLTFLNAKGKKVTKGIKTAYYEIVDEAINNVAMGKETFFEALEHQIKTIGENGVQSISYDKTGYHRRIDSALRMNLQDGLNQLSIAQQEMIGKEINNDGWELTVHEKPAKDHVDIQGHIFENKEFNKLQDYNYMGDITDINGVVYTRSGEEHIRPIGELNCKHRAFAIVIGVDKPRYSVEELNAIKYENNKGFDFEGKHYDTLYDGTQLQRRLELELRKVRETKLMATGEQLEKLRSRERMLVNKYHELSKASGLPTKLERTRILTKK